MSTSTSRSIGLPVLQSSDRRPIIAMIGNPNAGKTTLFNRLTGLRARTANFPGITIERTEGIMSFADGEEVNLVDLPGLYSVAGATDEERVSRDVLLGQSKGLAKPAAVVVVLDATNLQRNLFLVSQVIQLQVPVIVALNMIDLAESSGIQIDVDALVQELGCPVEAVSARTGRGVEQLRQLIHLTLHQDAEVTAEPPMKLQDSCAGCSCPFKGRYDWAEQVADTCLASSHAVQAGRQTEKLDQILTHPIAGVFGFFTIMLGVFWLIFSLSSVPMDLIDAGFGYAQALVSQWLPEGEVNSLVVDGIIGGIGGVLVFLPQICILFFVLSLLEDTGYLARAAFVMDRLMQHVGLPGKAFVPMLSAHACAIPGIMTAKAIEDKRDRLITILTLPLLTCSARLPVYAMVIGLLFGEQPLEAALLFTAAYCMGIFAVLACAFVFKRTILPGQPKPLILELPSYKIPSLRTALLTTLERAKIFIHKAGTTILMISVLLWAMATYPKSSPPAEVVQMQSQAAILAQAGDIAGSNQLLHEAELLSNRHALAYSVAGRLGKAIEPVVRPLGFDWQIGIGVVSSFAAREVIVSTLAIVYGVGEDAIEENDAALLERLRQSKRADGSVVFTTATCLSLLTFYVLAMQCLPTQVVTRRITGSWKWAAFQFTYMTVLAYSAAFTVYQTAAWLGYG